jgi:hypothetical protein
MQAKTRQGGGGARLLALAAVILMPELAGAQTTPEVLYACYQPSSGVVYRVNPPAQPGDDPNIPDACKTATHTLFSWTEGVPGHDHGALNGLGDDDHSEYVREGETAGGDLGGTYPNPTVDGLQGNVVSSTAPSDGQVLAWNNTDSEWQPATPPSAGVPSGAIIMWTGSTVPDGWALCDGTNGTPDLRGRFVLGSVPVLIGTTGGSSEHVHTVDAHTHDHDHPSVRSSSSSRWFYNVDVPDGGDDEVATHPHSHETDLPNITSRSASPATSKPLSPIAKKRSDHLPPFYSLAFIMKL